MGDVSPASLMTGHRDVRESPTPPPATAAAPMAPLLLVLVLARRAAPGAALAGAACYQPQLLAGVGGVVVLLFTGVVWPAVWSRDRQRRRAAAGVLRQLLDALFPGRPRC